MALVRSVQSPPNLLRKVFEESETLTSAVKLLAIVAPEMQCFACDASAYECNRHPSMHDRSQTCMGKRSLCLLVCAVIFDGKGLMNDQVGTRHFRVCDCNGLGGDIDDAGTGGRID